MSDSQVYETALKRREVLLRGRAQIDQELADLEAFVRTYVRIASTAGVSSHSETQSVGELFDTKVEPSILRAMAGMQPIEGHETTVYDDSALARSRPSAIMVAAEVVLREAAPEPVSVGTLVEVLTQRGVRLGEDDASRKRRVTSVLSAAGDPFEAERGTGWRLKGERQKQADSLLDYFIGKNKDASTSTPMPSDRGATPAWATKQELDEKILAAKAQAFGNSK